MTTTCERVVKILVNEGKYRELAQPMKIGSLSFTFDCALVGSGRANDLVIVIELKGETSDEGLIRKILALTRALDVLRSRRPVTAVLTSGPALPETIQSLGRVCRVLPIGAPSGPEAEDVVRDWLLALLPISEPAPQEGIGDWASDLHTRIPSSNWGAFTDSLVAASLVGKQAVEALLANTIRTAIKPVLPESEDDQ